ncbi:MAG: ATP-dependent helicase [Acidobacteriota bacterium]
MPETARPQLDEYQLAAVNHVEGPLEVVAGPGAGKTLILVERAARLYEHGAPLSGMILVTFTTRAAGEMRQRLQLHLGLDLDNRSLRNVSTIHALAYRILRAAKKRAGQPGWQVADENEAYDALRQAMAEAGARKELYTPRELARQIEAIRGLPSEAAVITDESVLAVYRRYQQILAKARKWDLAELVPAALQALRQDDILASLFRSLCLHLMVDEWQDVSVLDYEFLKELLQSDNIFVVGSPAQSIYGWRHAHYEMLSTRFRGDFPHLQTIVLERNYRSTRQIVEAAAALVPNGYSEVRLRPVKGEGPPLQAHMAYDQDSEADLVADILQRYHEQEGLSYRDMAVLCREWKQSAAIERALEAHAIPYDLGDRLRFYQRAEVREIVSYLVLSRAMRLNRPAEEDETGALEAVINVPPRGIGPNSLHRLRAGNPHLAWRLFFAGMVREDLREQVRQGCRELFEQLAAISHQVEDLPPEKLVQQIVDLTGYRAWLEEDFSSGRSNHAVETLLKEAAGHTSTAAFLRAIRSKMNPRLDSRPGDLNVTLSSIHGAKGLEWSVVIVIGLYEGSLPHVMSHNGGATKDPPDERRLAYVALSRAADHLHLTAPRHVEANGHMVAVPVSRYLQELPEGVALWG